MERLKEGMVVQHFKRETLDPNETHSGLYLYMILHVATHTETKEKLVVYKALYRDDEMGINFSVMARPYDMFMSEVDRDKYPNIKQKYRFEEFNPIKA